MTARRLATALLLALALTAVGCDSRQPHRTAASGAAGSLPPDQQAAVQQGRAELDPCPASTAAKPAGGLPDVTLSCLGNGPAVHLSGLTGKPTVVNVWAAWCTDCGKESSYLSRAYDTDRSKVRFLGVDTADGNDSALSYGAAVSPPVHYPSVVDPDKKVLLWIPQQGPPATIFFDAAGRRVHLHPGAYTSFSALQHDIATYLHVTT